MGSILKAWIGDSGLSRTVKYFLAIRCKSASVVDPSQSLTVSKTTLPPLDVGMSIVEATEKGLQQDHLGLNYLSREDLVTLRDTIDDFLKKGE